MKIIEPHIHMYSRTTDDYQRMYDSGIRVCVEPSFWLGASRRHAGTFFDYFSLILDFETIRAERFGIDHYAAVSVNPKEAENLDLANEVLEGMEAFLTHPRCIAIGEIGFNNISDNEEKVFLKQLEIAGRLKMPVIVHLPHQNKVEGIKRTISCIRKAGVQEEMIVIDHNTEDSMPYARETKCFAGMTVYPYSKLSPGRVSAMLKQYGTERMLVNGSADWGISDPISLVKVADFMRHSGHPEKDVSAILLENPNKFYSQSPKWTPDFDIVPQDPREYQR